MKFGRAAKFSQLSKFGRAAKFRNLQCETPFPTATVHVSYTIHLSCFSTFLTFLLHFFVSSKFVPCNSFCFLFFWYFVKGFWL